MIRVAKDNINTPAYWDKVYSDEKETSRQRVDIHRLGQLVRWIKIRGGELERKVTLLDYGCGNGEVDRLIRKMNLTVGVEYHGLDISEKAIAEAIADPHKGIGSLYGVIKKGESIPYSTERFDVVWCGETLEHVDTPLALFRDLVRVTGEGGLICLSVPYRGRNRSPEHVWEFAPADLAVMAREVGELEFLDCRLLKGWLSMFCVIRRNLWSDPS